MSSDPTDWAPGQGRVGSVINGKWQVDARLGSGGMATVYAATHRNGHRAALKMLHATLSRDPPTRARFLREGYVANAVGHPGVVAVLDDGVAEDGSAFLVLELLEGETIDARRVRLGGALPIDEALDLADQALDALAAAHEKGIIHRDIKPENVFYTHDESGRPRIKLLDFGLARMKDTQAEATKTGVTIGTPEFMPPEQALGRRKEVDARSDVWGLGATLFTAITGRYVHDDAQSLHEQLIASATRRSRPIRSLAPHVSPDVANVIDKALELEMSDRWQSAREMQTALREARGEYNEGFSAESLTVQTAGAGSTPLSSNPFSKEKPLSSDQTMKMQEAPRGTKGQPKGQGLPLPPTSAGLNSPTTPRSPTTSPTGPRLPPPPGGRGERKNIEDQSDMEETFIERTHASPGPGVRAGVALPISAPGSRVPSSPTAIAPPHTSRMRERPNEMGGALLAGMRASRPDSNSSSNDPSAEISEPKQRGSGQLPPLPRPSNPPVPPTTAEPFRAPILTPSSDHDTVAREIAAPLASASPRTFGPDSPTAMSPSPRAFPIGAGPPSPAPGDPGVKATAIMSPRSFPLDQYNQPVDAHGATVAVSGGGGSPRAFRASAPPPPPPQQQYQQQQQQYPSQPLPGSGSHMIPPMQMGMGQGQQAQQGQGQGQGQRPSSGSRIVIYVAVVFVLLSILMAGWVVYRDQKSREHRERDRDREEVPPTPVPMPPVSR